jgi:hypothetical protein
MALNIRKTHLGNKVGKHAVANRSSDKRIGQCIKADGFHRLLSGSAGATSKNVSAGLAGTTSSGII